MRSAVAHQADTLVERLHYYVMAAEAQQQAASRAGLAGRRVQAVYMPLAARPRRWTVL